MAHRRECTRCSTGTEVCQVGSFYLCDSCDSPKEAESTIWSDKDLDDFEWVAGGGYTCLEPLGMF